MSDTLRLFLDLGDVFSKGIALRPGRVRRVRYPSVTAARLLDDAAGATDRLLDGEQPWPAPEGFDAASYPRTRSYQEAEQFLGRAWSLHGAAPSGARFAGYVAAAYGAERELLGAHPTDANVEALVRKAFLMTAEGCARAEVTLIVDQGVKAGALGRYAQAGAREVELLAWRFNRREPRRMKLQVELSLIDAVDCARAALPADVAGTVEAGLLVLDVGYLRTKLAVLTAEGCAHQEVLEGLGLSDCVRRVLRDGQEQGLFEDELAVMYALEQSQSTIEVAGRSFDVRAELEAARGDLASELARAAERALIAHAERSGTRCRSLAILGGAAPVAGEAVERALREGDGDLERVWVTGEPSFLLVQGARVLAGA